MSAPETVATQRQMPDVADHSQAPVAGALDRVGMSEIEIPVRLPVPGQISVTVPAKADAYVNLVDPQAKGIHMSRLYLRLNEHLPRTELSMPLLKNILQFFLESHADRSDAAHLTLRFELPLERASLKSGNKGWRSYPVELDAWLDQQGFRVRGTYSSTCPCSAALARQLIQERFLADYGEQESVPVAELAAWLRRGESICATPHSQRSYASITVQLSDEAQSLCPLRYIDLAEGALKTPVQAAVKREDEQEFARVNGANLMFCEDAGRRLRAAFDALDEVDDYRIEARHVESLHPHDAVSVVVKGVSGGLQP